MTKHLSSTRNQLVQHLRKVQKNRSYRLAHASAIIQGKKTFDELYGKVQIKAVLAFPSFSLPKDLDQNFIYTVDEEILKAITGLPSPEGVLAEVSQPQQKEFSLEGKTLVLDRIQDPGNLGNLVRTACAFSWDRVVTLDSSCDFFNDKVIRSSKGAVFKIPCFALNSDSFFQSFEKSHCVMYVGDMNGQALSSPLKLNENLILALGNEAKGPSQAIVEAATSITIPISKEMESLNVAIAGGIIMSHFNLNLGQ